MYQKRNRYTGQSTGHAYSGSLLNWDDEVYVNGIWMTSYQFRTVVNARQFGRFRRPVQPNPLEALAGLLFVSIVVPIIIVLLILATICWLIFMTVKLAVLPAVAYAWIPACGLPIVLAVRLWTGDKSIQWWHEASAAAGLGALALAGYYVASWFDRPDLIGPLFTSAIVSFGACLICA